MGGLARKKPVGRGHRRKWVLLQQVAGAGYQALKWSDGHTSLAREAEMRSARPHFVASRGIFEEAEREGRAIDLAAPGDDAPPRGMRGGG